MIRLRSILIFATATALAVPTGASADPNPTRVSLAPQATYVSPQQINLEVGLTCAEGLSYFVGASVLQQQGALEVFGSGFASGECAGQPQRVAIPVFTFAFPGWQLGNAIASVFGCGFTCDSTARTIRIGL
jgi:hypothetical protein